MGSPEAPRTCPWVLSMAPLGSRELGVRAPPSAPPSSVPGPGPAYHQARSPATCPGRAGRRPRPAEHGGAASLPPRSARGAGRPHVTSHRFRAGSAGRAVLGVGDTRCRRRSVPGRLGFSETSEQFLEGVGVAEVPRTVPRSPGRSRASAFGHWGSLEREQLGEHSGGGVCPAPRDPTSSTCPGASPRSSPEARPPRPAAVLQARSGSHSHADTCQHPKTRPSLCGRPAAKPDVGRPPAPAFTRWCLSPERPVQVEGEQQPGLREAMLSPQNRCC